MGAAGELSGGEWEAAIKTEVGGRKSDVRGQRTEDRGQGTGDRGQGTEDGR